MGPNLTRQNGSVSLCENTLQRLEWDCSLKCNQSELKVPTFSGWKNTDAWVFYSIRLIWDGQTRMQIGEYGETKGYSISAHFLLRLLYEPDLDRLWALLAEYISCQARFDRLKARLEWTTRFNRHSAVSFYSRNPLQRGSTRVENF